MRCSHAQIEGSAGGFPFRARCHDPGEPFDRALEYEHSHLGCAPPWSGHGEGRSGEVGPALVDGVDVFGETSSVGAGVPRVQDDQCGWKPLVERERFAVRNRPEVADRQGGLLSRAVLRAAAACTLALGLLLDDVLASETGRRRFPRPG